MAKKKAHKSTDWDSIWDSIEVSAKKEGWNDTENRSRVISILVDARDLRMNGVPAFLIWLYLLKTVGVNVPEHLSVKFINEMTRMGIARPTDSLHYILPKLEGD